MRFERTTALDRAEVRRHERFLRINWRNIADVVRARRADGAQRADRALCRQRHHRPPRATAGRRAGGRA